jgi:hypothetical protein
VKRVIGLVVVFGALSYVASGACAAQSATRQAVPAGAKGEVAIGLAPADEYFGPLKLSILGISNTIRDLGLRYDVNHDIAKQTYASALLTEQAMQDWEHKYPHDRLLPRAVFFLQRLYTKILIQPARDHAKATAKWMFADFGRSPQAKQLQHVLAVEHLAALPAPTPTPSTLASPPSAPPSVEASPRASPSPAPSGSSSTAAGPAGTDRSSSARH